MNNIKTRLTAFKDKLKGIKNIELIIALLIIALVLIIYSSTKSRSESKTSLSQNLSTEEKLEQVLSEIEGAGDVKVFIYYGSETVVKTSLFGTETTDAANEIKGVVVVAEGAGNIGVLLKLSSACSTALDISPDKIEIYKMK